MKTKLLYALLFLPFLGFTQHQKYPAQVELNLVLAGTNRPELEKVISYFRKSKNPLKIQAAFFLIANMDIHFSASYFWEDRGKRIDFNELNYKDFNTAISAFNDIKSKNPGLQPRSFKLNDLTTIKADYLIENINSAFFEWQSNSTYSKLALKDFCEYILPYRINEEPLQNWRPQYEQHFGWFRKKYKSDGLELSLTLLATDLRTWFVNTFSWGKRREPLPCLGAAQILFRKKGQCVDLADVTVFAMRSNGIPAAVNYIPYWATSSDSHFLNTIFERAMRPLTYDVGEMQPISKDLSREPSKVLRLTYSKQSGLIADEMPESDIPAGFLRTKNYIDVTSDFWEVTDIKSPVFSQETPGKFAFLSVFNGLGWKPTWWGEISKGNAYFKNMPKGVVFLPMYYRNGKLSPAGYPIAEGYKHEAVLKPDMTRIRTIEIKEKDKYLKFQYGKSYKLFYWDNTWKLLGTRTAGFGVQELLFPNAPANALFLLIPQYSQRKERPFMILDNGEMLWW